MLVELCSDVKRCFQLKSPKCEPNLWAKLKILFLSPVLLSLTVHRYGFYVNSHFGTANKALRYLLKIPYHFGSFVSILIAKVQIIEKLKLGPAIFLSSRGNIILGAEKIGKECTIHHNVTIGLGKEKKAPEIGDRVWIGPDTLIFGNIKIGDGVTILESTVVNKSLPPNCLVKGNPGRIIKRDIDNVILLNTEDLHVDIDKLRTM